MGNVERKFVLALRLRLRGGRGVIRDRLIFIDTEIAGIGAHKAAIENPPGKGVEVFFFQGFQVTAGDFGRFGDLIQSNASHFPFAPQPFAE